MRFTMLPFLPASVRHAARVPHSLVLAIAVAGSLSACHAAAVSDPQHDHAADAKPTPAAATTQSTPASADAHAQHSSHTASAPVPPAGQRWATDEPLRDGMGRIRQAVTMLEHLEMGHVDPKQAPAFADQIQSAVNDMIANCKLDPDADAALHGLLVKFIAGADAVRTGPVTLDKLKPMQDALAQYPTQFDDPTWDAASVD